MRWLREFGSIKPNENLVINQSYWRREINENGVDLLVHS